MRNSKEHARSGKHGTWRQAGRFRVMPGDYSQAAQRLRVLAARMRAYAAETSIDAFRRQFEHAASELEETAIDLESRGVSLGNRNSKSRAVS